jgi:glycosyltransferase involved in cell wall biosynthesis/SAM-dependent methyltransferase/uncharacterized protein YbaR (Trm112 family)
VPARFLFVIHYPVWGGPHNQALRLAEPLAARGWETIVVLPDEPGNAAHRLRGAGVEVVQMPLSRLRAVADPRAQLRFLTSIRGDVARIRRLIRGRDPQLVVVGGLVNPQAALAARLEGVPVVWQLLDTRAPRALRLALMPFVRRLADVVMTNGYEVAVSHPGAVAFGDRLFPFFSPVDLELFRPDEERRASARAELGIAQGELVIGTVGNLTPMKDHGTFLRAAREVLQAFANARFVILGASYAYRDDYTAGLWRQAEQLGLLNGNRLIIRDPGARVADLAPALDVFWLTSESRSEGTSTAVGEAMALALPVVATNVGALRETIVDGETGFLVPPRSPEQLAGRTHGLLENAALREKMGAAARERAARFFGLDACLEIHLRTFEKATSGSERRPATPWSARELFVCPVCRSPLGEMSAALLCPGCEAQYPLVEGIPLLLPAAASGSAHKLGQARFFDEEADPEFEISRPHGTPRLYRWLLEEKFRRSVSSLRASLAGSTVLTVCGGSGMEAEMLARAGATVVCSDLSLGAALRARERSRRYGVAFEAVVADTEALPFADGSIDLVYVHDGLHHLERPLAGLAEMSRVAGQALSVNEPARAAATQLAVHLGVSREVEEAGNPIERLDPGRLATELRAAGFAILKCQRYAMFYRHEAGPAMRLFSTKALYPIARVAITGFNLVAGDFGNKFTVQARRPAS